MDRDKLIDRERLIDLIDEAVCEFYPTVCPHCDRLIDVDNYVTREDIEKWLRDREDKELIPA